MPPLDTSDRFPNPDDCRMDRPLRHNPDSLQSRIVACPTEHRSDGASQKTPNYTYDLGLERIVSFVRFYGSRAGQRIHL